MNQGKYLFSQLMYFASQKDFETCVSRYDGNWKTKHFSCWKQYLSMAFGQLTHRESLSDTVMCLGHNEKKLYHLGIGQKFAKSTLSKANENRNWRIYRDFTVKLVEKARRLYVGDPHTDIDLKQNVFAIDASIIDLCLSVFSWARFRETKAAVKLHAMLDLKNQIPDFVHITDGCVHDVNILDKIDFSPDDFYVMDRGYIDFKRLHKIHTAKAFFVIRSKRNLRFAVRKSQIADKSKGLKCDQHIRLTGYYPSRDYPQKLRRIKYHDQENNLILVFLTNNFELCPLDIAELYRHRWKIELFFKWIKQHLKIKSFWGHSENAVKTQIWIAISVYVLVAIAKKKLNLPQSMYEILQILSINIFDKTPIKATSIKLI